LKSWQTEFFSASRFESMRILKILINKYGNLKMKLSFLQINAKVEYYTNYDDFFIIEAKF